MLIWVLGGLSFLGVGMFCGFAVDGGCAGEDECGFWIVSELLEVETAPMFCLFSGLPRYMKR
jgi:hypothetical protein